MYLIDDKYQKLTQVDIEEQKRIWNERGKGYYGEYLVFSEVFSEWKIPGCSKILMNLHIPTENGRTTEIDLMMIHETGIYIFEVKHFKGNIYGKVDDLTWTQYFRTAKNEVFKNPVKQNEYHINAVSRVIKDVPLYSYIVFTNEECRLHITGEKENVRICELSVLAGELRIDTAKRKAVYNKEEIDKIFCELKKYSPVTEEKVKITNEREAPIYEYLDSVQSECKNKLSFIEKDYDERKYRADIAEQEAKRKAHMEAAKAKRIATVLCAACLVFCVAIVLMLNNHYREKFALQQEHLDSFAKKFERVEEFNNGEVVLADDLVVATDVVLKNSESIENAVIFSYTLKWNGKDHGIRLAEDSKYIVHLTDGTIQEYDVFGETFRYSSLLRIGRPSYESYAVPETEFYNVNAEDIEYIKLTGLKVWKNGANYNEDLYSGYETELYLK